MNKGLQAIAQCTLEHTEESNTILRLYTPKLVIIIACLPVVIQLHAVKTAVKHFYHANKQDTLKVLTLLNATYAQA